MAYRVEQADGKSKFHGCYGNVWIITFDPWVYRRLFGHWNLQETRGRGTH